MSEASERVKRWRKANPEKYRAQRRKQYKKNPTKHLERSSRYKKSEVGRAARLISRAKNRERENALSNVNKKRLLRTDPRRFMLQSAKHRAAKKGIPFSLVVADVHVPTVCPLLGILLSVGNGVLCDSSPTLDRIFNDRGYVPGNVIIISYAANRCKGNLCADDVMRLAMNLKVLEAFRD